MHTLELSRYPSINSLLKDLMDFNISIKGVLSGINPGTVYVDQPDMPQLVMLISPEGTYIAGTSPSDQQIALLKKHIIHLMDGGIEALWLTCHPAWQAVLDDIFTRPPLPIMRQHYICTTPAFNWRSHIPEGFAIHRIDEALLARKDLLIPEHVHDWIENNWTTQENFLTHGFGFVTEALDLHQIVSWSLCDCIGERTCEIGIHTHPEYRRRGFAALTSAAAVEHALTQGMNLVGWHCNTDNIGSQATALKVGFTHERDYVSFAAFQREAVHWAEAGRIRQVAGDYSGAAECYVRADSCDDKPAWGHYIPYYAACAFASQGDYASAWTWLHRAVAQGFDDVATLHDSDELIPMHTTPQWNSLIESIHDNTSR